MSSDPDDARRASEGTDVHHVHYDPDGQGSLSAAVVEAIAAAAGVDPAETRVPIDRTIDPDALDALFAPEADDRTERAHLVFSVWDMTVVVHNSGHIFVHDGQ